MAGDVLPCTWYPGAYWSRHAPFRYSATQSDIARDRVSPPLHSVNLGEYTYFCLSFTASGCPR
ncbi:hypothetical protein K523DRAFT_422420, partial [Schizophyllum commune Tattone D]